MVSRRYRSLTLFLGFLALPAIAATVGKARPISFKCAPEIVLKNTNARVNSVVENYINGLKPATLQTLADLVAIRSFSQVPEGRAELNRAAEFLQIKLRALTQRVDVMPVPDDGGGPMLFAEDLSAGPEKPIVLIYAHYDVVDGGNPADWINHDPFKMTIKDGRIYGRGTSDDKGNIAAMIAALEAYKKSGTPYPVNWKILLEGNEEQGSGQMSDFLQKHRAKLRADVVLACDGANYSSEIPGIEVGARGFNIYKIELRARQPTLHSGLAGGLAPVPSLELASAVSALSPPGMFGRFNSDFESGFELPEYNDGMNLAVHPREKIATELGVLPDQLPSENAEPLTFQNTMRPSVNLVAFETMHPDAKGVSSIHPYASATLVVRSVAPMDAANTRARIEAFIADKVSSQFEVAVTTSELSARPWSVQLDHPGLQIAHHALQNAYGVEPRYSLTGGALPILAVVEDKLGKPPIIFWGASDGDSRLHSANESIGVANLDKTVVSLIYMLDAYGQGTVGRVKR